MVANNDSLHIKFNKERNAYLEDVKIGKVVSPVALQLPAFVAGLVAGIQSAIGAYSFQTTMFLTRVCFVRPDNCAKTLVFAWQGSGVAINQLQKWSKGQN